MELKEIKLEDMEAQSFIEEQCQTISSEVGDSIAINALSGGVDSSVVSMLGHRALGDKLKTYFIDNGIMREGEPEYVVSIIEKCGVPVELVDARDEFFDALKAKPIRRRNDKPSRIPFINRCSVVWSGKAGRDSFCRERILRMSKKQWRGSSASITYWRSLASIPKPHTDTRLSSRLFN